MDHMPHFLDILRNKTHKWSKLGSLGDMVDASLGDGGYKEVFKKERLVGKLLFGKQRKTISDMMKRIGVKNVKHRVYSLCVYCMFLASSYFAYVKSKSVVSIHNTCAAVTGSIFGPILHSNPGLAG